MASAQDKRLILFTRLPRPGAAKTRLVPALGEDGAAACQRAMTEHVLAVARGVDATLEVHVPDGDTAAVAAWLGPDVPCRPQHGADLGARLDHAVATAIAEGAGRVVVIGADIPGIGRGIIEQAFAALHRGDAVLGPAADGGYYLIGLKRAAPELFADVAWGGPDVFATTHARLAAGDCHCCVLPPLADVDRAEDLPVWDAARAAGPRVQPPEISVVVPALNEAGGIAACLASVGPDADVEAIVVDAGSTDGTAAAANAAGATVVHAARGRGTQMNAGAELATGRLLLFLHADTRLPPGWRAAVLETMQDADTAIGAFSLALSDAGPLLRLIAAGANVRSRLLRLPYGDQALFMRADRFRELGGYRLLPLLEDVDLVQRLREHGRLQLLSLAVTTSSRRWREQGLLRTTWRNHRIILAWLAGAAPEALAKRYPR